MLSWPPQHRTHIIPLVAKITNGRLVVAQALVACSQPLCHPQRSPYDCHWLLSSLFQAENAVARSRHQHMPHLFLPPQSRSRAFWIGGGNYDTQKLPRLNAKLPDIAIVIARTCIQFHDSTSQHHTPTIHYLADEAEKFSELLYCICLSILLRNYLLN